MPPAIASAEHGFPGPLQWAIPDRGIPLAKPNYSFEKRQREIAKKKKQDEKDARKREAREAAQAATPGPGDKSGPPASG